MSNLYCLAAEYRTASDVLHDSDMDEQTILDTLEGMSGALETKATNLGFVIRNLESMAEQIKQVEDTMKKRRQSIDNQVKRLKAYLMNNMQLARITKVESPYFVLSLRNNAESVVIDAESQIPADYMREIPASYEPDKNLIKQAIKDGFEVPGCHLTKTQSVQIK